MCHSENQLLWDQWLCRLAVKLTPPQWQKYWRAYTDAFGVAALPTHLLSFFGDITDIVDLIPPTAASISHPPTMYDNNKPASEDLHDIHFKPIDLNSCSIDDQATSICDDDIVFLDFDALKRMRIFYYGIMLNLKVIEDLNSLIKPNFSFIRLFEECG